jgi:hypothetical protein
MKRSISLRYAPALFTVAALAATTRAHERGVVPGAAPSRVGRTVVSPHVAVPAATVTNLNDSGPGSLRQAIANAVAGESIAFAVTGTIVLISGELVIGKDLTILGPGPGSLTISGNNSSRVFSVDPGVSAQIQQLSIRHGTALESGGGISNGGALVLVGCTVSDNASHSLGSSGGGGIFNAGTLMVLACTIANNLAHIVIAGGGGILNAGTLELTGSIVSGNSAESSTFGGGGILNQTGASVTVSGSRVVGNSIDTGTGGGIYSDGTLLVVDSTLSENSSLDLGGGVHNDDAGTLVVWKCTLTANYATVWGGGIYNNGTATIHNCTLSGNLADEVGGAGLSNIGGTVTMSHSILVANFFSGIENLGTLHIKNCILADSYNCLEPPSAASGVNFATDNTCGPGFTLVTLAQLGLGPLADNGGPTWTHALGSGSVAIDAAIDCTGVGGFPVVTDQRGIPRPQGAACDVGPFELIKDFPVQGVVQHLPGLVAR